MKTKSKRSRHPKPKLNVAIADIIEATMDVIDRLPVKTDRELLEKGIALVRLGEVHEHMNRLPLTRRDTSPVLRG